MMMMMMMMMVVVVVVVVMINGPFSRSSHTSDFKPDAQVAILPGAWCCKVSAGAGRPVSVYCDWVR